jgi:hypothetical protein
VFLQWQADLSEQQQIAAAGAFGVAFDLCQFGEGQAEWCLRQSEDQSQQSSESWGIMLRHAVGLLSRNVNRALLR